MLSFKANHSQILKHVFTCMSTHMDPHFKQSHMYHIVQQTVYSYTCVCLSVPDTPTKERGGTRAAACAWGQVHSSSRHFPLSNSYICISSFPSSSSSSLLRPTSSPLFLSLSLSLSRRCSGGTVTHRLKQASY